MKVVVFFRGAADNIDTICMTVAYDVFGLAKPMIGCGLLRAVNVILDAIFKLHFVV